MDALLLEKAEIQQSFALSRKDLEKNKKQAKVKCIQLGCVSIHFSQFFFNCMFVMILDCRHTCM